MRMGVSIGIRTIRMVTGVSIAVGIAHIIFLGTGKGVFHIKTKLLVSIEKSGERCE